MTRNEINKRQYEYSVKQIDNQIDRLKTKYHFVDNTYIQRFYSILAIFVAISIFILSGFNLRFFLGKLDLFMKSCFTGTQVIEIVISLVIIGLVIVILIVLVIFVYMVEVGRFSPSKDMDELMEDLFHLKRRYMKLNEHLNRQRLLGLSYYERMFLNQFDSNRPEYHRRDIFDFIFRSKCRRKLRSLKEIEENVQRTN